MIKQRPLGASGLNVSEIGFGAGGFWGMEIFKLKIAAQLLDMALSHGVTFFDTGPNYSNGNAESRLGNLLGSRRWDVLIGTKCGTQLINGRHVKDYGKKAMRKGFEESLRRLGRDYVDLLQLHGLPSTLKEETIEFLLEEKSRGRAKAIGVSTDDVKSTEIALAKGVFDAVMIEYNVIRRRPQEDIIERCAKAGMGVLAKSPLAQTLYSNEIFKISKLADVWYLLRALKNHRGKYLGGLKYRFLSEYPGRSCHSLALQYVLGNPNVSSAIIGSTTPAHLASNYAAAAKDIPPEIKSRIQDT